MKDQKYYCYRYFIVPNQQSAMFGARNQMADLVAACRHRPLEKKVESGKTYGLVYVREIESDVFLLKFYRNSTVKKYTFNDNRDDITETYDLSLPFIYVVLSTVNQIVLLGCNSSVFQHPESAKNAFRSFLVASINDPNITLSLDPIVDNAGFWHLVRSASKIYRLSLTLRSPNLFGTAKKTSDFLAAVQEEVNNDSLSLKFENESGALKISEDEFGDALAYADGGGGEWSLEYEERAGREKATAKSGARTMTVMIAEISEDAPLLREADAEVVHALAQAEQVLVPREGVTE